MYLIRRLFAWRIASPVLSGLLRSFVLMFLGAFVLSVLLWGSGLEEGDLSLYTYIVHGLAALLGGGTAGRRSERKGWYQGGMTGLLYGAAVLTVGFLALDTALKAADVLWVAGAALLGCLGGMFGVNLGKR